MQTWNARTQEDLRDEGKIKETAGKHEEEDEAQKRNETRMARAAC